MSSGVISIPEADRIIFLKLAGRRYDNLNAVGKDYLCTFVCTPFPSHDIKADNLVPLTGTAGSRRRISFTAKEPAIAASEALVRT